MIKNSVFVNDTWAVRGRCNSKIVGSSNVVQKNGKKRVSSNDSCVRLIVAECFMCI